MSRGYDDDDDDAPPPPRRRPKAARGKPKAARGRKQTKGGFVSRWVSSLQAATRWAAFWGALIAVFFVVVAIAGLFSGGHVAVAMERLRQSTEAAMAEAGLKVEQITIDGQSQAGLVHLPKDEVLRILGIHEGDLMIHTDIDEARTRIEALPGVKSAEVRRIWPNRISVRITERRPVARWQINGQMSVIDADGETIAGELPSSHMGLPLVVGRGANTAVQSLLALVASQPHFKFRVKSAVRAGERRWDLQLDNGVQVRLPEEGAEAALAELVRLDREQKILSRDIRAIDLRFSDRYYVKLPPGSPLIAPVRLSGGRET